MPQDQGLVRFSTGFSSDILSVSELNRSVRDLLEHRYPLLWVRGEISNFIAAKSGHFYFVLKDAQAQVRCAMFRNRNQHLTWLPRDGMQIEMQGLVTLYEARGEFQLIAETLRQAGRGTLFEAFLRLKEKLEKEGLFDAARKRPLPTLARSIGIVTSAQGAALRDVLATLARRNPSVAVFVYPTPVQGEGAGLKIAQAISVAGSRGECDVLIICRGGGSIEDLWAFNDETVARAVRACPIPVISGVGHETDFTIADFAADVRAPTPTAAAELVCPERSALLNTVSDLLAALRRYLLRDIDDRAQMVDHLSRRLQRPGQRLRERETWVAQLGQRLERAGRRRIEQRSWMLASMLQRLLGSTPRVAELAAQARNQLARMDAAIRSTHARDQARLDRLWSSLEHLAPQSVLERGYSLVRDGAGQLVRDAAVLRAGAALDITFANGGALARVESVEVRRN
ncbi:MAG: exodeoxyribonuclease VII large subunit [Betaproteobacteria bacterium RIFCSPLOWO2_02_FULL_62_17]|nr:MAG: exodeoxyribonuclease VII large subunit [Betaproteobacteria bacterium RIFCSPLOWO2_02_FULL_62_17]